MSDSTQQWSGSAGVKQPNSRSPAQLAEQLRAEQRQRWQAGDRIPAENYLRDYPELRADADAAMDLIYSEFLLREQQGEHPDPADYLKRFPEYAATLAQQVELHRAMDDGTPDTRTQDALAADAATPNGGTVSERSWPNVPGYEILDELGRGGMGVVYKARHLRLKRIVALKMLLAGAHADAGERARLRSEAEAVARLQHPNVVQVYEVGEADTHPFLALEYVDGGNLKRWLSGAPQPALVAASLMQTLAEAVQAAHQRGIVHRDLKPANILLVSGGVVSGESSKSPTVDDSPLTTHSQLVPKITDFGLAKQLRRDEPGSVAPTQSGAVLGTPSYMAPEQAAGRRQAIGPAVDVYALGAILYELLTGRPPFQGETPLDTLQQVLVDEPVVPSRLQRKIPRDLETICLKCLEKDPQRRYPSASALADDLRRFQSGLSIVARPVGPLGRSWRWSRRNPGWAAMLACLAGLVLLITAGTWVGVGRLQQALDTSQGNLQRAKTAERDIEKKYVDALIEQARASHRSRRSGQRFETLDLLKEANERARRLALPGSYFDDLRDVAIASLAMPDLYPAAKWEGFPIGSSGVAFDESLSIYARANEDGSCEVCRLTDGKPVVLHSLPGLGTRAAPGFFPRLSGDGRFVAVGYVDGRMRLWNLAGSSPEVWFEANSAWYLHFRADSRQAVLAHRDGRITHYDLVSHKEVTFAAIHVTREIGVAIHPSAPLVAVCSYYHPLVQLRDLHTGRVFKTLPFRQGAHCCAWHPDGRTLATAEVDGPVRLFDTYSGRLIRHFGVCGGGPWLAFNHMGDRLAEGDSWDGNVRIWDVVSGRQLFAIPSGLFAVNLRFAPDGRRLAPGAEGSQLIVWRVGDGREYRTMVRHLMPTSAVYVKAAVHPAGRLLAVTMTDGVGFWDLATGEELRFFGAGYQDDLIFEPQANGGLLMVGRGGVLRCAIGIHPLGPTTYEIGRPQQFLKVRANAIALNNDGSVMGLGARAVSNYHPFAGVWLRHADKPDTISLEAGTDVANVSASPDGRWLASSAHDTGLVKIWDARTGQLVKQLPAGGWGIRFSLNGRWLATSAGALWRVAPTIADWSEQPRVENSNGFLAFSPDSRLLAIPAATGHIRLFDVESGHDVARLEDPDLHSSWVTFSPDGTQLIAVEAKGIHVWDLGRIRSELVARGEDWELPPYPPAAQDRTARLGGPVYGRPEEPPPQLAGLACDLLRLALTGLLASTDADLWFRSGQRLGQLGCCDAALCCYSQTLHIQPDHAEALLKRSTEYLRRRRWADAIVDLSRVAEHPSLRSTAVFNRSLAYLQLGRHGEADADRQLLRGAYSDFSSACRDCGELFARQGDQALAILFFEAVLHFRPNQPELANSVAWMLVSGPLRVRNAAAALPLAQRAVALRPKSVSYRNTLGVVHYRVGQYQEAISCLNECLEAKHELAGYDLYFLAMAHHRLGHAFQAREYFDQADEWANAHTKLSAMQLAEVREFRGEAAALLGLDGERTSSP